jgi:hypothetical protein
VLPAALDRQQPVMLSSLYHEAGRLAFAAGDLGDAAVLVGAVSGWMARPEVTLAAFITDQGRAIEAGLVSSLGSDDTAHHLLRGATMATADLFTIVRRCLDEE